eukprot:scaffold3348_cov113-Isochrysis_galbana.AAC.10
MEVAPSGAARRRRRLAQIQYGRAVRRVLLWDCRSVAGLQGSRSERGHLVFVGREREDELGAGASLELVVEGAIKDVARMDGWYAHHPNATDAAPQA